MFNWFKKKKISSVEFTTDDILAYNEVVIALVKEWINLEYEIRPKVIDEYNSSLSSIAFFNFSSLGTKNGDTLLSNIYYRSNEIQGTSIRLMHLATMVRMLTSDAFVDKCIIKNFVLSLKKEHKLSNVLIQNILKNYPGIWLFPFIQQQFHFYKQNN